MSIITTHDITLHGKTGEYDIVLRPLCDEHLPLLYKWNADPEVVYWSDDGDTDSKEKNEKRAGKPAQPPPSPWGGLRPQVVGRVLAQETRPQGGFALKYATCSHLKRGFSLFALPAGLDCGAGRQHSKVRRHT